MIIGNKADFAIEMIIDLPANFPSFGYLRFWIENAPVGDIERITIITALSRRLEEFVKRRGARINDTVFDLPDAVFWATIGNMRWGVDSDSGLVIDTNPYDFILCPTGTESFDRFRALVVENTRGQQKVVFGSFEQITGTVFFDNGFLEKTITDYLEWVAPIADQETSLPFQERYGTWREEQRARFQSAQ